MTLDPDPVRLQILLFSSVNFQDATKYVTFKSQLNISFPKFFCWILSEVTFTSFFKIIKKSQKSRNQGFLTFCLMMGPSGSGTRSVPLTNGSGRPKTYGSYGTGTPLLGDDNIPCQQSMINHLRIGSGPAANQKYPKNLHSTGIQI